VVCKLFLFVTFFVSLSLDPPYNFFSFSQSLFSVVFLEISLKTVYPTYGIDGKRWEKVAKGWKRFELTGLYWRIRFFM